MKSFSIIDLEDSGLSSKGKGSAGIRQELVRWFNLREVEAAEISLEEAQQKELSQDGNHYALLVYNELSLVKGNKTEWLEQEEKKLEAAGYIVLQPMQSGRIIGIKSEQNRVLQEAGILMPDVATGVATQKVFSNAESAAHVSTQVVEAGAALNNNRYNTALVDTVHSFEGQEYYVCIRSQAVGKQKVCSWIRARPVSEGDPSVHTRDTPVDARLVEELHERLIAPKLTELKEISTKIGEALGFGYYCHDILPCAATGELYVCETNYKIYDSNYKFHMRPIAADHPIPALFDPHKFARMLFRATMRELA